MNSILNIQESIDYIEEHILESISIEELAKRVYMSQYHFQRMFGMITGYGIEEYIRNRRLSMAGEELLTEKKKIIDIAMKYGYEYAESFSRAFSSFHGISPSQIGGERVKLKLFPRLRIRVTIEGGMPLEYRIVKKSNFSILMRTKEFKNSILSDASNMEIPEFEILCKNDGTFEKLHSITGKKEIYGLCGPISRDSEYFEFGIGTECDMLEQVPKGYKLLKINHPEWAVFNCMSINGKDSDDRNSIEGIWNRIFTEFLPTSPYEIVDEYNIEIYPNGDIPNGECEIWIPIKNKKDI